MTVLAPLFLLGLAAIAVPLLLHLLRRRERRTFVFPALRYLKRTTREHARILRLRQLLLLALRISALVVAVLAGARLILPIGGSDDPPAAVALVVDNGLRSAAVVGDDRILDSLTVRAMQILDRTGPRDRVWVVPAGAPWEPVVPRGPEAARDEVRSLESTDVTADLVAAVGRATSLLGTADEAVREVIVLSDLGPGSLPARSESAPVPGPSIRVAPPPAVPAVNRGIGGIEIAGGLAPRAGDLAELQVRVVGTETEGVEVRGYIGDDLIGSATTGSGGLGSLALPRLTGGWVRGRVELEPDDLRADDVAHFAFRAIPAPRVGVGGGVPSFLDEALAVLEDAGRIERVDGAPEVQFLAPPLDVSPDPAAGLVILPPADPALLPALNRTLQDLLPGWSLGGRVDGGATELEVAGGQLLEWLPGRPSVRSVYELERPSGERGVDPLLTLSDGTPWTLQTRSQGRPVVLVTSPLTAEASDLPTSASMLPLLEILTGRLAGGEPARSVVAGEPIPVPEEALAIRLPDGTLRTLGGTSAFSETGSAGTYEIVGQEGDVLSLVAVNPVAATPGSEIGAATAVSRLSTVWTDVAVAEPWPSAVLRERRGREVAGPLLLLLFVLLLAESWLAATTDRSVRGDRPAPRTSVGDPTRVEDPPVAS